jgi:hypothetical protein
MLPSSEVLEIIYSFSAGMNTYIYLLMQHYLYIEETMHYLLYRFSKYLFCWGVKKFSVVYWTVLVYILHVVLLENQFTNDTIKLNFLTIIFCLISYTEKTLTSMCEGQLRPIFIYKRTQSSCFFCLLSMLDATTKAHFLRPRETI